MTTQQKIRLKPEWYYSENDLSQLLEKPVIVIRKFIKDRNIPIIHMLNRRLVTGKSVNQALTNVNLTKYKKQLKTNLLEPQKEYRKDEAILLMGVSDFKFNERYINEFNLKPRSKNYETGTTYYKGSDINKITKEIGINKTHIAVYPETVDDNKEYYTAQLIQNLGVNYATFNNLYIKRYNLKATHTDKIKHISQPRIYYKGSDVNRITYLIREDYHGEM